MDDVNSKYLQIGSILKINHSELNAQIIAFRADKGVDKYNFQSLNLRKWLQLQNIQVKIQEQSDQDNDSVGNTFGMWIIEDIN